jgi:hypothetical protein
MPRLTLLALLGFSLTLAATPAPATACPAPGPNGPRCTKYDHMFKQMLPAVYVRVQRGVLAPRTGRARALRHLMASTWTVRGDVNTAPLRFLDPADVPDVVETAVRNLIVQGLTWRADHYDVAIDGAFYAIQRCRDDRGLLTTCLVRIDTL